MKQVYKIKPFGKGAACNCGTARYRQSQSSSNTKYVQGVDTIQAVVHSSGGTRTNKNV